MTASDIVALGGGGFSGEPWNRLLDDFVLGLTGRDRARVGFLPTAAGDSERYVTLFYESFRDGRATPDHLPLFARGPGTIRDFVLAQDVLYVGGGNTANMLAIWRIHGVDVALREAWERGAVFAGVSAGMLCWFEAGVTDSFGPLARLDDGLGFLSGSACPHYDGEAKRRPTYQRLVAEGFPAGVAADDGAALHFVGTELRECVASRPDARAYRVALQGGVVVEEVLPTRYLGPRSRAAVH